MGWDGMGWDGTGRSSASQQHAGSLRCVAAPTWLIQTSFLNVNHHVHQGERKLLVAQPVVDIMSASNLDVVTGWRQPNG